MGYFQQNREIIAKVFKIVGGIIMVAGIIAFIGWIICKAGNFTIDFNWVHGKFIFGCGFGIYETGIILDLMDPEESKRNRYRELIGIGLLMCCSVICVYILLTSCTTYIIVPITLGLIGEGIGRTDTLNEKS